MSTPKLFAYKNSINLLKVKAFAKLAKFNVEIHELENQMKPLEVVDASPTNTVPYLVTEHGTISESSAINSYIAQVSGLFGSNPYEQGQVHQWLFFAAQELSMQKMNCVYPLFGFCPFDNDKNKASLDRMKNVLKALDKHLNGKHFLVGDKLSVADMEVWVALKHWWQFVYVEQVRTKMYAHIDAWFHKIANLAEIKNTFGLTHCAKSALKVPKLEVKKEEKKEEKPKKEDKPKKEEGEEEEEKPKAPKGEVFPESKLDFDAFKKAFMNSTDRKAVLDKFFSEEYDKNAFSVWYLRYQKIVGKEGKVLFMTVNGRDSFLARSEAGRKHVFANFGVYGVEGDYEIKGVWMWRGLGCPQFMEENPQFEYYDKVQLNPEVPADRERIYSYWLNLNPGDVVENLAVVDMDTFK